MYNASKAFSKTPNMQPLCFAHRASTTASLSIPTCRCACASDSTPPAKVACWQPTSQGCPGLDHAGISMTHLAGFMQLAESEAHEEHGVDAAQHPGQLLLVCLQQWDSFPQCCSLVSCFLFFSPYSSSYVQNLYMSACSIRSGFLMNMFACSNVSFSLYFPAFPFCFLFFLFYYVCMGSVHTCLSAALRQSLCTHTRLQQRDRLSSNIYLALTGTGAIGTGPIGQPPVSSHPEMSSRSW
jgi:hypothetical protein